MLETEDTREETQHPIITYTNRLQKQLNYVTSLSYGNQSIITRTEKQALLGVIANLPPEGQTALKKETNQLLSETMLPFAKFHKIYSTVHKWIYTTLLKEAFEKAKPLYRKKGHLEVPTQKYNSTG